MSKVQFSILLTLYFLVNVNGTNFEGNLIQISCSNKNSDVQILKASLIPCTASHSKCISQVEIKGWLNANEERETFLLIDEVFDLKEQIYLPLLHPYLIQVSASETIASFPLNLEENVDVSCSGNDVKRREAHHHSHVTNLNEDSYRQTTQNYNDLLNAIKEEESAIKRDIQNFLPKNNGTSVRNEHDLLFYFDDHHDDDANGAMQPQVNLKNDKNMQHQHDKNRKLNSFETKNHKIKFKMEQLQHSSPLSRDDDNFNRKHIQLPDNIVHSNHFNQNNQFEFGGFSNKFEYIHMLNTTDRNVNRDGENYNYLSQQKPIPRTKNRFPINQHKFGENSQTTGVINHHHYHDLNGHDIRNQAKNGNSDYVPNVIDVHVKFRNQHVNDDPKPFVDDHRYENQLSNFQNSQSDKFTVMNYKFLFDDNQTIPIDLSIKAGSAFANLPSEKNVIHDDDDDDKTVFRDSIRKDNEEWNENLSIASSAGHQHETYSNSNNNNNEIDSIEDDMNLLIEKESTNDDVYRNGNELANSERFRRNADEVILGSEGPVARSFSIYKLEAPIYKNEMKIQIFRMQTANWVKLQPTIVLSTNKKEYRNGSFLIQLNDRRELSELFDRNHMRLLISDNKDVQEHCIVDFQDDKIENLNDEIKKSFCSTNDKLKRSIIALHDTGLIPTNGNVITKCPTTINADRICLNLVDNDAITWRLNVVIPFLHNEILDKRLPFVKISNIYIDTSDGINMFAQFEITSMDHFTRDFHLSFTDCDILEHLNISNSFILPPNKSIFVNMTMAIPFYTVQYKEQKCKVNIMAIGRNSSIVVAQRDFLISPRNRRCLCLWMCSCFCFDYFLTAESKDLCQTMSTKNEIYAGFVDDMKYDEDNDVEFMSGIITKKLLMLLPLMIVLIVLMMGCIKAILGCCFKRIDIWKFNHVQSCKPYRDSGRCWKIFVNMLFFFLLPIVWCLKFCTITNDGKIHSEDSFHIRSVIQKDTYSDEEDEEDGDVEKWKLLRPNFSSSEYSSIFEKNRRSSETIFNVTNLRNPFEDNDSSKHDEEDEMFAKDTEFVVNAINESHESLRKLSHHSEEIIVNDEHFATAEKMVKEFLAARIVYRRFNKPIGSVIVNDEQQYSVRGYFIPAQNTGYQFITYNPIKQFYQITSTNNLITIAPQNPLDSKAFRRYYANKIEVLEANDLSLRPSTSAPCINVLVQDVSMYGK